MNISLGLYVLFLIFKGRERKKRRKKMREKKIRRERKRKAVEHAWPAHTVPRKAAGISSFLLCVKVPPKASYNNRA